LRRAIDWPSLEAAFDILCPMHLRLTETGHIVHVAPTLQKLRANSDLFGKRFLEVFRLDRPRSVTTMSELMARARSKLHLELRDPPSADFAATDLAIEMLYLVEAKSAAMDASRNLNQRLQGAKLAAEEQAATDPLTGLKNRRAADRILETAIAEDRAFAVMQLDLDFFKAVNDSKGHAAGDLVLQEVAKIMRAETRRDDVIARVGGDEFLILIEGGAAKDRLKEIATRLIRKIEQPIPFEKETCHISASIGITRRSAGDPRGIDALIQSSDRALYASKSKGRACASFDEEPYINALRQP